MAFPWPWRKKAAGTLSPVGGGRGWVTIFDWTPGSFQQDAAPVNTDKVLANWAVYACLTLIAQDVGKISLRLVEEDADGIWVRVNSPAFSPVLRKPNAYQTRQQFIESWILSKLGPAGNAYVLKVRDNRGVVVAMHVLNPYLVTPMVAPDGSVFYALGQDELATIDRDIPAIPASEIIHDRASCLRHPLVGVSPIYAVGLAAMQGQSIQENAEQFFRNRSMPGGIITAPTQIDMATAERIKKEFNARYTGDNAGKTAVLGDGLKYEAQSVNARDSQLIEQLGITAKMVCSAYHVPPFKIGLESLPAGQKVEDMNRVYYADCLQTLFEAIEALLDDGLGLTAASRPFGAEFDLDDLLRMDTPTLVKTISDGIGAGAMAPNEGRKKLNLSPVSGGESPYLQQQNYSLDALARRDAQADPFGSSAAAPASDPSGDVQRSVVARVAQLPSLCDSVVKASTRAADVRADFAASIAELEQRLEAKIMMPVAPVRDRQGRLVGAKRVESLEQDC